MPSIPELVIIDLFNTLVDRIKQAKPSTTSGKPTGGDIVYSQLLLGMPIDPDDYANPWSPIGGASLAGSATPPAGVVQVAGTPSPTLLKALEAAFHTSQLCNIMLQVTNDGTYQEYPVGRHLAFQYAGIVNAMVPKAVPPMPAAEQAALNAAMQVLFVLDNTDPQNPVVVDKTPLYKTYQANARAYAKAKAAYAAFTAQTLADPTKAASLPMLTPPYQQAVDDAWNDWKTEGADKIEAALAAYESQGINMQQAQIAAAKKQLDIWSLGLAGVPTNIPYSYVDPSAWCDPTRDDIGFEQLQVKRTSESHVTASVSTSSSSMWWNNGTSSYYQNGHAGFLGYGASESSAGADQHTAAVSRSSTTFSAVKMDQFTDFEIDLEWGLVTIYRPWLISDLFYMNNWFIPGERANCVSNGQVETQLKTSAMLPMIPQQMLVVRNVSIKSSSWGDFATTLNSTYNATDSATHASQSSGGGSGGFSFAGINFGGGGGGTSTSDTGSKSSYGNARNFSRSSASFDGTTLSINGSQIIAFVSDIVPPSPTMDDPDLPKPKKAANTIAGAA